MKPALEYLEERCCPTNPFGYSVVATTVPDWFQAPLPPQVPAEIRDAPPQLTQTWSQLAAINIRLWEGSTPLGRALSPLFAPLGPPIPWAPNQMIQVNLDAYQTAWSGFQGTTFREPQPIGYPSIVQPVVFATVGTWGDVDASYGQWELRSIYNGWLSNDWPGWASGDPMPHGPTWGVNGQYGNTFTSPPNYTLADDLLLQGNPYWWYLV